jgi:hypothetical protein
VPNLPSKEFLEWLRRYEKRTGRSLQGTPKELRDKLQRRFERLYAQAKKLDVLDEYIIELLAEYKGEVSKKKKECEHPYEKINGVTCMKCGRLLSSDEVKAAQGWKASDTESPVNWPAKINTEGTSTGRVKASSKAGKKARKEQASAPSLDIGEAVSKFAKTITDNHSDTRSAAMPTPKSEKKTTKPTTKPEVVKAEPLDPEKMSRQALIGALEECKKVGATVAWSKKDSDDILRVKLAEALEAVTSPEVMATVAKIDVDTVKDCIGVFIDMRAPNCLGCPTKEECVKQFLQNMEGDFSLFKQAQEEAEAEEQAALVEDEDVPAPEARKAKKEEPAKVTKKKLVYKSKRQIQVNDVKNPVKKKDDAELHGFVQEVLDEVPGTFGELREILFNHFEEPEDEQEARTMFLEFVKEMLQDNLIALA